MVQTQRHKYKKVKIGDEFQFPAPLYNDMIESIIKGQQQGEGFSTDLVTALANPNIVTVVNVTGADVQAGDAYGLGAALILDPSSDQLDEDLFTQEIAMEIETLEIPKHFDNWVILLDSLEPDEPGPALKRGVIPAKVWVRDEDHRWAELIHEEPLAGSAPGSGFTADVKLSTCHGGSAKILWIEAGIVDDWAWAYIEYPHSIRDLFKATEDINDNNEVFGQMVDTIGNLIETPTGSGTWKFTALVEGS